MAVHVVPVDVMMRVRYTILSGGESVSNPSQDSCQIQDAQHNQHDGHGKFHGQPHPRWDDYAEQNDDGTHHEDSEGVSQSPEHSNQRRLTRRPLTADDGAHSDDMVGIGCVTHTQKEAQQYDSNQSNQTLFLSSPLGFLS